METGYLGIFSTILWNIVLILAGSLYLILKKPALNSDTYYNSPSSISSCFAKVYHASTEEIISIGGQDSFLYLSLLKLLLYLTLAYTFIGLIGLIPIYSQQSLPASTFLSQFSIEKMNSQDLDMLIPALCISLFSSAAYFVTYYYYNLLLQQPNYFPKVFFK